MRKKIGVNLLKIGNISRMAGLTFHLFRSKCVEFNCKSCKWLKYLLSIIIFSQIATNKFRICLQYLQYCKIGWWRKKLSTRIQNESKICFQTLCVFRSRYGPNLIMTQKNSVRIFWCFVLMFSFKLDQF